MDATNGLEDGGIGFLSILDVENLGFCGGYLVLNRYGRPLEFHCTLPLKIERAHQILYGDTLHSHLYGEYIGPSLFEKSKRPIKIVLVDARETLALQKSITVPVVFVDEQDQADPVHETPPNAPSNEPAQAETLVRMDTDVTLAPQFVKPPHQATGVATHRGLDWIQIQDYLLRYQQGLDQTQSNITQILDEAVQTINLVEPFQRIHEAIHEAHSVAV